MDLLGVAGLVLVAAIFLWLMTFGRRYMIGERKGWPQIRRDIFSGSVDEGMYPLDPQRDDEADESRPEHKPTR